MKHYQYIFAGAGLAALMTVYRMAVSGRFTHKRILLIDPDGKKDNDRTWCFWERGKGNWDNIVFRKWDTAIFANHEFRQELDFDGYSYKMVRGEDFYRFIRAELLKYGHIEFLNQKVTGFEEKDNLVLVNTETETYTCDTLLNSVYDHAVPASQNKYPLLQQHFIGWHIKTDTAVFNKDVPVFMDFSVPQKGNTRFMYVLPVSTHEAIVEYTLFSADLLPEEEYEREIRQYLEERNITSYEIVDKERGAIPMTSYKFWKTSTTNVLYIGSAGGWTKASTGYTFKNSDKLSHKLVGHLVSGANVSQFYKTRKFWFYDLLLLDILYKKNYEGSGIFSAMFKKGKAAPIFKFLDEETTFAEDLKVIWSCPKGLFIKALWSRLFNL